MHADSVQPSSMFIVTLRPHGVPASIDRYVGEPAPQPIGLATHAVIPQSEASYKYYHQY